MHGRSPNISAVIFPSVIDCCNFRARRKAQIVGLVQPISWVNPLWKPSAQLLVRFICAWVRLRSTLLVCCKILFYQLATRCLLVSNFPILLLQHSNLLHIQRWTPLIPTQHFEMLIKIGKPYRIILGGYLFLPKQTRIEVVDCRRGDVNSTKHLRNVLAESLLE